MHLGSRGQFVPIPWLGIGSSCECSELIRFGGTLAKFWPSCGHEMTENVGFWPSSEKVFTQFNWNLVCTLTGWVFITDLLLGHVGQILALYWPQNDVKWWFLTTIWKSIHVIQFKLGLYTYWVCVQNWFIVGPCWPNFGPLLATNLLKMVVSDYYLKKNSSNPIQPWTAHLLGECSELIRFKAMLAKFWPSSAHKMTENGGFRP